MRTKRAGERVITIPRCLAPVRRAWLESQVETWLRAMMPESFDDPFTPTQHEIIEDVLRVMREGGNQGIAAPRGDGKTTIVIGVLIYAIATGLVRFPVAIGSSATMAEESILTNIKSEIEENKRLARYYPEMCVPIRELEGSARRAGMQTYIRDADDKPTQTRFSWSGDGVIFPRVEGARSAGVVLKTRGSDAAIRGLLKRNQRPDFVLIDDPDTEESAHSEVQTAKRINYIKRGVSRLARGNKRLGCLMLTTIQARGSVSDVFTDPAREPAWNGKRHKMLIEWPERADLWDTYMRMRRECQLDGDLDAKAATEFYRQNRHLMDIGSRVSNPNRFAESHQISAIQACYDIIADDGEPAFLTECQNEPPDEQQLKDSGIHPAKVCGNVNGCKHRQMPAWATVLTAGIDVGKYALHWVVKAFGEGFTGAVVDYGVTSVIKPVPDGIDFALMRAMREFRDSITREPIVNADGVPHRVNAVLVDSGWQDSVVHDFARESGSPWFAAKGFGQSAKSPFHHRKTQKNCIVGEHSYREMIPAGELLGFDADWWKRREHEQWMMDHKDGKGGITKGCLTLYGETPVTHKAFADHICGEIQVQEFPKGKPPVWKWDRVKRDQHWLDASVMANVGASWCKIRSAVAPRRVSSVPVRRKARKVSGGWQR